MHQVNYSLLGTHPEVEQYRDTLPDLIAKFRAAIPLMMAIRDKKMQELPLTRFEQETLDERNAQIITLEACAEHFYGIDFLGDICLPMEKLIDMIEAADQELEFA